MTNGFVPEPPQSPTPQSTQFGTVVPIPADRHVRRGQEEYAHALSALLPQGIAWPRWSDSTLMRVVYGLSGAMGWADGRAADLLERESDPRQTVEMLDSWERAWGLPDPCYQGPQSVGERQQALVLRMTMLGAQSREFFYGVADFLGYKISITEYRPFMVGVDRCGDNRTIQADGSLSDWPCQIGYSTMRFAWTVHMQQPKLVWFRAAKGQCGIDPHLRIARAGDLECLIHRWQPAHTQVLFDYSGISDPFAAADRYNVAQRAGDEVVLRSGVAVVDTRPTTIFWPQAPNAFYVGSPTSDQPSLLQALAPADPATTVWQNAVVAKGGTISTTWLQQTDFLIKQIKQADLWTVLDRLWIFGGESELSSLVDLVAGASAINVNSAIWSTRGGFQGGPGYVNTNFNPATAPGRKYQRNSSTLIAWVMPVSTAITAQNIIVSSRDTTANSLIAPWTSAPVIGAQNLLTYFAINDANAAAWNFYQSTSYPYGYFGVTRSGVTSSSGYYNGIQIQFSSNPSAPVISSPVTFCGMGNNYMSPAQLCLGVIAGGMTAAQHRTLYTLLRNFFLAVGVDVGTPPAPPL